MKNRALTLFNRVAAVCLASAVLISSSSLAFAAPGALSAEIVVSGANSAVTLNGEPVVSGRTFYANGVVGTTDAGSATINLGKLGRVQVLPGSKLNLSFADNSITGELTAGKVQVYNNEGVSVSIKSAADVITNDKAQVGNFTVDMTSGTTRAFAENGAAFMNNAAVPQDKDDDDDDRGAAFWLPVIFAGAVATAVILVVTNGDDDDNLSPVSPVR